MLTTVTHREPSAQVKFDALQTAEQHRIEAVEQFIGRPLTAGDYECIAFTDGTAGPEVNVVKAPLITEVLDRMAQC